MSCTERCRKAGPGQCCCSCSGEHHGEAAPIQQKRLGFESTTRWNQNPGEPATEVKMALALGDDRLEANYALSPEARSAVERDLAARNGINLAALAVEVHPDDCAEPCCATVLDQVRREAWAGVALREDAAIMASGRLPHDRSVSGRLVHLSPAYRYTLDSDVGEPIWWAWCGDKHASAVDPDVAARKALGL